MIKSVKKNVIMAEMNDSNIESLRTCEKCCKTYQLESYYLKHIKLCQGQNPGKAVENEPKESTNPSAPFNCDKCGKNYKVEKFFLRHKQKCNPPIKYTGSGGCDSENESKTKTSKANNQLNVKNSQKCENCGKQYKQLKPFLKHKELCLHYGLLNTNLGGAKVIEELANQPGASEPKIDANEAESVPSPGSKKESQQKNKTISSKPSIVLCEECGIQFDTKADLRKHVKSHKSRRAHHCQQCGKTFAASHQLKVHQYIHTGERLHPCSVCGQRFVQSANMVAHMRTHTGEKPFLCTVCGKTFARNYTLNLHLRTHTGEKPYKCNICGTGFGYRSDLNRHIRTHTGEKPYICTVCGEGFHQYNGLASHTRIHPVETPYRCPICDKKYNSAFLLKCHIRKHPGGKQDDQDMVRLTDQGVVPSTDHDVGKDVPSHQTDKHSDLPEGLQKSMGVDGSTVEGVASSRLTKDEMQMPPLVLSTWQPSFHGQIEGQKHCENTTGGSDTLDEGQGDSDSDSGPADADQNHTTVHDATLKANTTSNTVEQVGTAAETFTETMVDMGNHPPTKPSSHVPEHHVTLSNTATAPQDLSKPEVLKTTDLVTQEDLSQTLKDLKNSKDITEDPAHPCDRCTEVFSSQAAHFLHQRESHDIDIQWPTAADGRYQCELCNKIFKKHQTLLKHIEKCFKALPTKPIKCEFCPKEYPNTDKLKKHLRYHTEKEHFKCLQCHKEYKNKPDLKVHMRKHTGEKPFLCVVCGKTFDRKYTLTLHQRTHTGEKQYTCQVCGKAFRFRSDRFRHQQSHTQGMSFLCSACGKRFSKLIRLKIHKCQGTGRHDPISEREVRGKVHPCPECGKQCLNPRELETHKRVHTGEKPYMCSVCGKGFSQAYNLTVHERLHSGEKPFMCRVCGKSFSQAAHLRRHKLHHTVDKPFSCPVCHKKFKSSYDCSIHQRVHAEDNPHRCAVCGEGFLHAYILRTHLQRHTGEKPYKCQHCDMGFLYSCDLKNHSRKHTGEKPYKCEVCGKGFSRLFTLKSHTRLHTGETPYRCTDCGKGYTGKTGLTKHLSVVHGL